MNGVNERKTFMYLSFIQ